MKTGKLGCFGAVFLIIFALLIIGKVSNFLENRSEQKKKEKQVRISAEKEQKQRQEFLDNVESHYRCLADDYLKKDFPAASKELLLFAKYQKLDYKDVKQIQKDVQIWSLEQKVRNIPVSKTAENLAIYRELAALDPGNTRYKAKISYYQTVLEEQKRKEQQAAERHRRLVHKFGTAPENSPWDGSVRCVKEYLKDAAHAYSGRFRPGIPR